MECGVIENKVKNGELKDLFEDHQFISDNPGCGNNWFFLPNSQCRAVGHAEFGPQYASVISEKIRVATEACDSLQGFMFLHSLGGGTGSGFGTYTLESRGGFDQVEVAAEYPKELKFSTCVLPSEDDDVNVSPYNTTLALNVLLEHADCVLPVDNKALFDIVGRIQENYNKKKATSLGNMKEGSSIMEMETGQQKLVKGRDYQRENTIVANMLSSLTCSMRYEGSLNVDLSEITMNLVPFPRMHFLMSSLSPLYSLLDPGSIPRGITQMFDDAIHKHYQMLSVAANATETMHMACGLIVRGAVGISEVNSNIERLRRKLTMPYWNTEGFKIGLCSQPSLCQDYSLLFLSNNSIMGDVVNRIRSKFMTLYSHRTFLHHFTNHGLEASHFDHVLANVDDLIQSYAQCESWRSPPSLSEEPPLFPYHLY